MSSVSAAPSVTTTATTPPALKSVYSTAKPFLLGGISGMIATSFIQPIDMIKVQIQTQVISEGGKRLGFFSAASQIIKSEGPSGFYKGLSAGLLRQATYTTTRMGIYKTILGSFEEKHGVGNVPFSGKVISSLSAGAIGAMVGTPCDLALVRMQTGASSGQAYSNVFGALNSIRKTEGVKALWSGGVPTVLRAMALNVGMLATYDESKEFLKTKVGLTGYAMNLGASGVAGFFASFLSLPFDFVKTRLQKQTPVNGVLPYKNVFDCVTQVARKEGVFSFYRGFFTYYVRIAPHAMVTLLTLETLRSFFP